MAITSKNLGTARRPMALPQTLFDRLHIAMYTLTLLLAVVAIYAIVGVIVGRAGVLIDDFRYGRPRMHKVEALVQHGDAPGKPTYLMAVNMNRQVTIIEIPGGDTSQTRAFTGPYLFGANEDLTPVTLDVRDVDGDGLPDILANVRNEQIVYLNRDGTFRLPTPEEQATLQASHP